MINGAHAIIRAARERGCPHPLAAQRSARIARQLMIAFHSMR
jgi:hypothetical protein